MIWEIAQVPAPGLFPTKFPDDELEKLLLDGWEPFAVTTSDTTIVDGYGSHAQKATIWLRRQVKARVND